MVYNKNTKKYVLWVNLNGGKADYAVGTSSTPEGPFVFSNYANAAVQGGGDFDILIDDDAARLATPPTNKQTKRLGAAQRAACAVAALVRVVILRLGHPPTAALPLGAAQRDS